MKKVALLFGGFAKKTYFCRRFLENSNKMRSFNLISNLIIIRLRKVVGSDKACM